MGTFNEEVLKIQRILLGKAGKSNPTFTATPFKEAQSFFDFELEPRTRLNRCFRFEMEAGGRYDVLSHNHVDGESVLVIWFGYRGQRRTSPTKRWQEVQAEMDKVEDAITTDTNLDGHMFAESPTITQHDDDWWVARVPVTIFFERTLTGVVAQ